MNGFTMCNLSLLTSDMWAVTVHAPEFHEPVDSLYFVAFGLVVVREASPFPHPFQGKNTSRLIKWTSLWMRWWEGLACLSKLYEEQQSAK
jgi:hypothetical protein